MKRFLSILMAFAILCSMMSTVAFAANSDIDIYVDNERVRNVNAYIDNNDDVWVEDFGDIQKIFPDETEDMIWIDDGDILLEDVANDFGYSMSIKNSRCYLYSDGRDTGGGGDNRDYDDVDIYKNGTLIRGVEAYVENGDTYLERYADLALVFPSETASLNPSRVSEPILLEDWADDFGYSYSRSRDTVTLTKSGYSYSNITIYRNNYIVSGVSAYSYSQGGDVYVSYGLNNIFPGSNLWSTNLALSQLASSFGYSYVRYENNIFLNNDGQKPIIVTVDGEMVPFTDQIPIVVNPGRTMIPIADVGSMLGMNVSWDGANQMVTLTGHGKTIRMWIDSSYYTVNGVGKYADVKVMALNGRTLVPIAFVTEALGLKCWYDSGAGTYGVVHIFK